MNWTKLLTFLWQVDTPTEKKAEPEPTFEILTNPARVVPAQEKFIKFLEESRYVPVKSAASGFVLLRDLRPTEPEVLSLTDAPSSTASTAAAPAAAHQGGSSSGAAMNVDEEPQPPQPFEYSTWCGFSFLKCLLFEEVDAICDTMWGCFFEQKFMLLNRELRSHFTDSVGSCGRGRVRL